MRSWLIRRRSSGPAGKGSQVHGRALSHPLGAFLTPLGRGTSDGPAGPSSAAKVLPKCAQRGITSQHRSELSRSK